MSYNIKEQNKEYIDAVRALEIRRMEVYAEIMDIKIENALRKFKEELLKEIDDKH